MRELTLSAEPQLLRMAIEPTERLPISIDLAARLDVAEILLSAVANDNGRNIASNVSVDGTTVQLAVAGLRNGTLLLLIITAIGAAGSVVRCVLAVRCIDPALRAAEVIIPPTGALILRGEYLAGVYRQADVVSQGGSWWVALLDTPAQAPGIDANEWAPLGGDYALIDHTHALAEHSHAQLHDLGSDAETLITIGALVQSSGAVTAPAAADKWSFRDSVSGLWAHITWANIVVAINGLIVTALGAWKTITGQYDVVDEPAQLAAQSNAVNVIYTNSGRLYLNATLMTSAHTLTLNAVGWPHELGKAGTYIVYILTGASVPSVVMTNGSPTTLVAGKFNRIVIDKKRLSNWRHDGVVSY